VTDFLSNPWLRAIWVFAAGVVILRLLSAWADEQADLRTVFRRLAVVVGVAYVLCIQGSYHFDDSHSVESNLAVHSLSSIPSFWVDNKTSSFIPENRVYRPLVYTFYAICWKIGGGATWPFHVMKMLMHAMVCLGLFAVWRRLWSELGWFPVRPFKLKFPLFGAQVPVTPGFAAFLLAVIFAVHPTTSECVDYISSTTSLQAALFYIWAFYAWLTYRDRPDPRALAAALGLYFLSVASKEEGITLVAAVALAELMLSKGAAGQRLGAALRQVVPFAVAAVAMAGWLYAMHSHEGDESRGWVTPLQYFITQWWGYLHYMRIWFWPWGLNADSASIEFSKSVFDARVLQSLAGNLALLAVAWTQRARFPAFLFGLVWFYVTISPTSSVVVLAEAINERRMYLPYLGFVGGAFTLLVWAAEGAFRPEFRARRLGWLYAGIVLGLVAGTQERNWVWLNDENLWADTVEKNPTSGRALNNLALVYLGRGEYEKAVTYFERCEQHWNSYMYCPLNKAIALQGLRKHDDAEKSFLRAYSLNPRSVHANFHLAKFYQDVRKDQEKAIQHYKTSVDVTGGRYPAADINLAIAYGSLKRYEEARASLRRALEIEPGNALALFQLGRVEIESGHADEATRAYKRLLETEPRHVQGWYNYGVARLAQSDFPDARRAFQRTVELDPGSEQGWFNLAFAAERSGDGDGAIQAARKLVEINPARNDYKARVAELEKKFGTRKL
jgi:tetratricopeptide (TPR) repeat protein